VLHQPVGCEQSATLLVRYTRSQGPTPRADGQCAQAQAQAQAQASDDGLSFLLLHGTGSFSGDGSYTLVFGMCSAPILI
jgi:hypothetical protein